MIIEYNRPKTLDDALKLIRRSDPVTYPLGGGTVLGQIKTEKFAVADLQDLGMDQISLVGNSMEAGATASLQGLLDFQPTPSALKAALRLEAPLNIRQTATAAGALVSGDGRSPYLTVLLALDTKINLHPGDEEVAIGNILPLRSELLKGRLISRLSIPLSPRIAFDSVARTPIDRPIVSVAIARWKSGRLRIVAGGFGKTPRLVLDGIETSGVDHAIRNSTQDSGDEWASAEYRVEAATILAHRCLAALEEAQE